MQYRAGQFKKKKKGIKVPFISWPLMPWKRVTLYRDLSSMLNSGLSLMDALETIAQTHKDPAGVLAKRVLEGLNQGLSFKDSLLLAPHYISYGEAMLLGAAEDAGNLPETLLNLAEYYSFLIELFRSNIFYLAYPIFLYFMGAFLLNIPILVRCKGGLIAYLIAVSKWFVFFGVFGVILLAITVITPIRQAIVRLKDIFWYVPLANQPLKHSAVAGYAMGLVAGLKAGFGITKVLEVAGALSKSSQIQKQNEQVKQAIESGKTLYEALLNHQIFVESELSSIRAAEKAGTLEDTFLNIANERLKRFRFTAKFLILAILFPFFIGMLGFIGYQVFVGLKSATVGQLQQIDHQIMREAPFRIKP